MKWFFKCSKIKKLRNLILPFCDFLPGPPPPLIYTTSFWPILTQPTHITESNLLKDSFEAVNMIHKIPPERFDQGYRYFSLVIDIFLWR